MTPRFDFQRDWPETSRHVDALLVRCRVPEALRDDLVQETALRIFLLGDDVDPDRSVSALAKTIAMNLLRDHVRKEQKLVPIFDLTLAGEVQSVEREVVARDEWRRVSAAVDRLSPAQRAALLATIGLAPAPAGLSAPAIRILRMRARRRLREILDAMSRGRDACALSARELWNGFPLRRTIGTHSDHGNQLAQIGSAVVAVVAASLMSVSSTVSVPPTVESPGAGSPNLERSRPSTSAGWVWSAIPVWSAADGGRLAPTTAARAAVERAREGAKKAANRLSLGRFGYVEGDDDEVHGIAIKEVNEVQETLRNPRRLVDRVKRPCTDGAGLCRSRNRPVRLR